LFRELVEEVVNSFGFGILYSGHFGEFGKVTNPNLKVIPSPDQLTATHFSRIFSWLHFAVYIFIKLLIGQKAPHLFIVSNPPITPWIGYLTKRLWKQRYFLLIYDLYPDMLVRFSGVSENSWIVQLWRYLNKISFENAEAQESTKIMTPQKLLWEIHK
jgi:hypothetical protein